ncbi:MULTISPECIES: Clp protease N-terminal domain-containing protein [unclassified Pseudofrankia]|uniref:Clp protease N-terminal domain-containing protein n=1 Tax=unclassified Pseudofrankia TaxID=2994372 RepID=UPI0008DA4438|nr:MULTISPECIES: Clp protease N-terminal domain-containing protein [unclassified Pseudofrankia]MDT3439114.1 Clp protease N-terminal domain-containing protein [Pseudofrankia sp. BMG5.37]OHV45757.1 Clp protease [Pseudofrankia sp. BMG5.36]
MHDLFNDPARRLLTVAQEEALDLGHEQIGTEHLLLALLNRRTGAGARVLASLGVTLEHARSAVEAVVGRGLARPATMRGKARRDRRPSFTQRAEWILERARLEAKTADHAHVGPEHILLSLLREDGGEGAKILDRLRLNREEARRRTLVALGVLPYPGPTLLDSVSGDLDAQIAALREAKDEALDNRDFALAVEVRQSERTLLAQRARATA